MENSHSHSLKHLRRRPDYSSVAAVPTLNRLRALPLRSAGEYWKTFTCEAHIVPSMRLC
jgi:hypothetical protein